MIEYKIRFSAQTIEDIKEHKKSGNKAILNKISLLLEELTLHPFSGTGKPEFLKHQLTGLCSRRISKEHRLIYRVEEHIVTILSAKGHYE